MKKLLAGIFAIFMSILCSLNALTVNDYQTDFLPQDSEAVITAEEAEEAVKTEVKNGSLEIIADKAAAAADETAQVKENEIKNEQPANTVSAKAADVCKAVDNGNPAEANEDAILNDNEILNDNSNADTDEYNEADNVEVLETIDISATEEDDVTLTIYSSPRQAKQRKADANRATVSFIETENGRSVDPFVTAVVSGNGNMEENVYRYFVDIDLFIETTRELLGKEFGLAAEDVIYYLPDYVTDDLFEVDAYIEYYAGKDCLAGPKGTMLPITDNVREALDPADMLKYSPGRVVIEGNVTSISEGAFLFCDEITEVEIPSTVKTIGKNAFSYCRNLTKVVLNEGLERIDAGAFMYCRNLEELVIPSTVKSIDADAFFFLKEGSRIICPTDNIYNLIEEYMISPERTVVQLITENN